jgi:ribose/xylose/arabinose/galactoside ABC-type transport system permease subunit
MDDDEKQKNFALAEKLISEQNFPAAVIAGAIAMLLAAVAYGIVVEAWPVSYGFAAAGVGIVIGFFIGLLGRGISMKFSVLAAVYTMAGCILGNFFVRVVNQMQATANSPIDVIQSHSLSTLAQWSVAGLSVIHLVFWFVAVVAAVFLAKRPLSRTQRTAIGMLELRA